PSQMQLPLTQCCPVAQAEPFPQAHCPAAEQRSALNKSQAWHCAPPMPQVMVDGALQTLPAQHPVAHELPSQMHAPPEQRCPAEQGGPFPHAHCPAAEQRSALNKSQAWHCAPPVPQDTVEGALHTFASQHPAEHEVESQLQAP